MSDPIMTARGVVHVSHHMFYLAESGTPGPRDPFWAANGVIASQPNIAVVYTGVSQGDVSVTVEVRHAPPTEIDTADWDEVVETTLEATRGQVMVAALMDDPPENFPVLTPTGPGHYRVRIHTRGRDLAPDGVAFEPHEEYRIVTWPGGPATETVHKQTDRYGAGLRESASVAQLEEANRSAARPAQQIPAPPSPTSGNGKREQYLRWREQRGR